MPKEILPDPQVEHKEIGKTGPKGEIAPATRLKITFADGHVIQEPQAAETFRKFVMEGRCRTHSYLRNETK